MQTSSEPCSLACAEDLRSGRLVRNHDAAVTMQQTRDAADSRCGRLDPMEPTLEFSAALWLHPKGSWVFLTVPDDESEDIRELAPVIGGFGSVRVRVTVGGSQWLTSVFPQRNDGPFVLPIKKPIRTKEAIDVGDTVDVELAIVID